MMILMRLAHPCMPEAGLIKMGCQFTSELAWRHAVWPSLTMSGADGALNLSVPQGEGIWYLQEGAHSDGSGTPMAESRVQVIIGGHD